MVFLGDFGTCFSPISFRSKDKIGKASAEPVEPVEEKPKPKPKPKRYYRYFVDGYNVSVYDQGGDRFIRGLVTKKGLEKIKRDFKTLAEEDVMEIAVDKEDCGDPVLIRRKDISRIFYEEEREYIDDDEREDWRKRGYVVKRELV